MSMSHDNNMDDINNKDTQSDSEKNESETFICEYCNKKFSTKGNLKTHMTKTKKCIESRRLSKGLSDNMSINEKMDFIVSKLRELHNELDTLKTLVVKLNNQNIII